MFFAALHVTARFVVLYTTQRSPAFSYYLCVFARSLFCLMSPSRTPRPPRDNFKNSSRQAAKPAKENNLHQAALPVCRFVVKNNLPFAPFASWRFHPSALPRNPANTARKFFFCLPPRSPRLRVKPFFLFSSRLRAFVRDLFFSSAFGINSMSLCALCAPSLCARMRMCLCVKN